MKNITVRRAEIKIKNEANIWAGLDLWQAFAQGIYGHFLWPDFGLMENLCLGLGHDFQLPIQIQIQIQISPAHT